MYVILWVFHLEGKSGLWLYVGPKPFGPAKELDFNVDTQAVNLREIFQIRNGIASILILYMAGLNLKFMHGRTDGMRSSP